MEEVYKGRLDCKPYQFAQTGLSLLQNCLCPLIHGLLLLLENLRVFALLQALEDLPRQISTNDRARK